MNFEVNLQSIVEGLVPQGLPPPSIRTLSYDLSRYLHSPNKNSSHLDSVLAIYRRQVPYTLENNKKWDSLKNIVENISNFDNSEEMFRFLSNSHLLSPTRPQRDSMISVNHNSLSPEVLNRNDHLLSPMKSPSVYAESFENLDRFSAISSHQSYQPYRNFNPNNLSTLENLVKPYYTKLGSEDDMLNYVPYTLLATTSDMFPMEFGKIRIPENIANAESGLLHKLFEAGLLYQRLNSIVEHYRSISISPMKKTLLVQIGQSLRNYTGFVNSLSASSKNNSLTLKSLYSKIFDQIIQLRYYNKVLEHFEDTDGDAYLSQLNNLRMHGDPIVQDLSIRLFSSLISYYYEYLTNWLTLGKLVSINNEFFIQESKDSEFIPYILNKSKIPDFIPKNMVSKIVIIGKTYIFLQKYCKELQYCNAFSKDYSNKYSQIQSQEVSPELFSIINEQYHEIVDYTNKVLIEKFHYMKVVNILKDILLMGKSDIVEVLIERASDVLSAPSESLSSYELTRFLQEAVQNSSFRNWLNQGDRNFVINGLDARVLDLGHGSIGWDVFTLDYIIEPPLSIVLNVNRQNSKKEYLRIFNFLWRFKKNNYFSKREKLRSNMLIRELKKIQRNRPLVRDILSKVSKINVLESQIQQFNSKLERYCFQDIIDKNFKDFETKLSSTKTENSSHSLKTIKLKSGLIVLDGILKAKNQPFNTHEKSHSDDDSEPNIDGLDNIHNQYLSNMLSHKLLASASSESIGTFSEQPYSTSLIFLLNSIYEFSTHFTALNDVTHEVLIQLNLHSQQEMNHLLSRFNTVLTNIVVQYKKFRTQSLLLIKDLRADGNDEMIKLSRYLR
ncbi:hypothetical protein Kpol_1048p14 [Vanderwaltozyma polyspora DSM 70294]|uniref:Spindle pole body component n=1 Tax=Vanderwaltozyma polyspora (strain ATCC 22028 / DSM 70294 / BCRC 21397 / CBS 2163 / NBRC 10782 / NRRL Y-8283 / UCD 57-17) TaxID=436907 RepID=A7TGH7_VANPO|nr:uncharacterized protein Kpol_1048p14 [Vanderwaltozyma polyspora DSM 70294]EDO18584.1 hypothetical protein Kpol_1048p14 [Vanderwaltozyma polyspora DSM 70294]